MSQPEFNLARIIAPTTTEQFFDKYWERAPLLIQRQEAGYYGNLFSLPDVDHILTTLGLRYPSVRLVRGGQSVPVSEYTKDLPWGKDTFSGMLNVDRIMAEYQQGATIVLQALQRNWQPLALFCRALEKEFSHQVQTNIYLTPPASQGLAPHYDTHDVFVLQIAGVKHWKLYEPAMTLPLRTHSHKTGEIGTGPLLQEFDLAPGDMLYLPRGYVHEAVTAAESTLHITVGMITYTWADVFSEMATLCKENPEFRTSLPAGFAYNNGPDSQSRQQFAHLAKLFGDNGLFEEALGKLADRFITGRPPLLAGHLLEATEPPVLSQETQVALRQGVIYQLKEGGEMLTLHFSDKKVSFPAYVEPTLRYLLDNSPVLLANLPGPLDWFGQQVMVSRLIKEGFLSVVSQ